MLVTEEERFSVFWGLCLSWSVHILLQYHAKPLAGSVKGTLIDESSKFPPLSNQTALTPLVGKFSESLQAKLCSCVDRCWVEVEVEVEEQPTMTVSVLTADHRGD